MTKAELIAALASISGVTKVDADKVLSALTEVIRTEVAKGGEISIPDLGKFEQKQRAERAGRNPSTGEAITIAAAKVPGFKAAKSFKDAVNK